MNRRGYLFCSTRAWVRLPLVNTAANTADDSALMMCRAAFSGNVFIGILMDTPATSQNAAAARRNVYVFGTVSFFNDTASEMAYWILPAFLISLGAGPAALGLIEGMAESVASLGKLFSGYLTDTGRRRKPLAVFGYT